MNIPLIKSMVVLRHIEAETVRLVGIDSTAPAHLAALVDIRRRASEAMSDAGPTQDKAEMPNVRPAAFMTVPFVN